MKRNKGCFGYAKKHSTVLLLYTLLCLSASAGVYFLGYFITKGNVKNWLTVIAVLGMLPTAKLMVSAIMAIKASKFACSEAFYTKIKPFLGQFEDACCAFDLYLTSYDKNFPIIFVCAKRGSLIGYMPNAKHAGKEAEEHIVTYLKKNSISGITVKIFEQEDKFFERFSSLAGSESSDDKKKEEILSVSVVKSLSL